MSRKTHQTGLPASNATDIADESSLAVFPDSNQRGSNLFAHLFVSNPSFETDERVRARSARPGAETLVTDQQSETTKDGEKR
jgi:hypothetical protein